MRQVKANILDFPKPSLDSLVWEKGQSLKPDVKQFILDFISSFAQANNLKDTNAWITEVKFVGSLTTNCYNSNSDMDIHIGVDLSKFIEIERPEMSEQEVSDYLDEIRKQVDQVKAKVPGTEHPTEIYFETKFTNKASQEFSGTYSVLEDKWTKYPHIVDQNFDIEKLYPELINIAKETASELDETFGDIKREIKDIKELSETIGDWPQGQRELFEKKLQKKLDDLEEEIGKVVAVREDVTEKRKNYKALSQQEITMKYLSKYFYMHVLTDLKTLLKQSPELSTKDIPVVENIMSQANLKLAYQEDENRILVDMDDTICKELPDGECGEPMEGVKEALTKLKEQGFEIVIFSHRADDQHGQDEIKQYLEAHEIPYDSIFQGEKPLARFQIDDRAIHFDNWNSVLKQIEKSDKKASLIIAYDRHGAYWIDPSGKVYPIKTTHEDWFFENEELLRNQYHYDKDEIGQDWWDIKTGNLLKQLLEDGWLRVGDLFAAGRKSIGTGIEIDNLNSIPSILVDFVANFGKDKYFQIEDLQKRVVELSVEELVADGQEAVNRALQREKMQSRRPVAAALDLPVIDPKTLNRTEPYALFIGTQMFSKKEGLDLFDVFGQHPMITEHNRVPTVTLDTLIKENIPVIGKEPKAGDKQPFQDISGVIKTAKLQSEYDFSSTQFNIPKELSEKIIRWAIETIPEVEIVYDKKDPGTKGIQLESHITLKYGLKTDNFEEVKKALEGEKAPHIKFGKTSFFEPKGKDYDVVIIAVESEDLQNLNKKLCSQVEYEDTQGSEYHPHVTVAYVQRGKGKEFDGKDIITGEELDLPVLIFSPKEGEKRELELSKATEKEASSGMRAWIDPSGKVYDIRPNPSHKMWVYRQFIDPSIPIEQIEDEVWKKVAEMFETGWTRVSTDSHNIEASLVLEVQDLKHIPAYLDSFVTEHFEEGRPVELGDSKGKVVLVDNPFPSLQKAVNKVLKQKQLQTQSSFMPSNTDLAPSDDWAGTVGYPTNESMDAPQNVSDEETWYSPENDRPRSKNFLKRMLSLFQKPLSKKEPKNIVPVKEAKIDNLNPITQSPEFKSWFGTSKVVDNIGEPLRVYHGTSADFDVSEFRTRRNRGANRMGAYFTDKPDVTKAISGAGFTKTIPVYLKMEKPFDVRNIEREEIANAARLGEHASWAIRSQGLAGKYKTLEWLDSNYNLVPKLKSQGYDGIIFDHPVEGITYVVFRPEQIKSAIQIPEQTITPEIEEEPKNIVPVKEAGVNKEAGYAHAYWVDPTGKVYPVRGEDEDAARRSLDLSNEDTHSGWILRHLDMLQKDYGIDPKSISGTTRSLVELGWTRIGDAYGTDWGIDVTNTDNIPSFVDDAIAKFAPAGSMITIAGPGSSRYQHSQSGYTFEWPVKSIQQTVQQIKNRKEYYQKQPVHAKQASSNVFMLTDVGTGLQTKALKDPTPDQAENLFNASTPIEGEGKTLRWAADVNGHLYMWDAYHLIHYHAIRQIPADFGHDANTGILNSAERARDWARRFQKDWEERRQESPNIVFTSKQAKQWVTPKEPINQPGMDWQWADYIYQYVDENWQDWLVGWMNLNPKNYVKPVILIEKIYEDEGAVSAWVHVEFVNLAGNSDAYMKLVISANIEGAESIEPEGREFHQTLTNWEIDVKDYGTSDEIEKDSSYGPTTKGPSVNNNDTYQDSAWGMDVTWSPEEDEELDDQNGAGGYPNRWFARHRGPYYTNEGKVVKMLEETSSLHKDAIGPMSGWLAPDGKFYPVKDSHDTWLLNNKELLNKKYGIILDSRDEHDKVSWLIRTKDWTRVDGYLPTELDLEVADIHNIPQVAEQFVWKYKPEMVIVEDLQRNDISFDREEYSKGLMKRASISGDIINHILNLIHQNGGATWNMAKGNLTGQPYFAVAIYPEKEQIVPEADFENLEEYIVNNEGLLNNPDNSFGAWVSGGKTYYDVVATIVDKNEAIQLGLEHKQLAIFDLKNLQEIPLQKVAKLAAANQSYWIDPSGEVYNVYGKTHDIWMVDESNLLKNKYGIDATKEDWRNLIERGWTRVNASDDSVSLEVLNIHKIPVFINKFIKEYVGETPKVFIEDRMNNSVTIPFFRGMIPKQAAAVSDKEQQKYYDEIYSDRWGESVDYINGGNEYYDYSELNGNDYPSAKDIQKEHVYMDLLDDPAVANFPAGLPEYFVTFYDSNPQGSDEGGI